jgi:hypothetical protein
MSKHCLLFFEKILKILEIKRMLLIDKLNTKINRGAPNNSLKPTGSRAILFLKVNWFG